MARTAVVPIVVPGSESLAATTSKGPPMPPITIDLPPARRRLRSLRVPVLVVALLVVLAATRGLNVPAAGHPVVALLVGNRTI
jgi:hypothetical protein